MQRQQTAPPHGPIPLENLPECLHVAVRRKQHMTRKVNNSMLHSLYAPIHLGCWSGSHNRLIVEVVLCKRRISRLLSGESSQSICSSHRCQQKKYTSAPSRLEPVSALLDYSMNPTEHNGRGTKRFNRRYNRLLRQPLDPQQHTKASTNWRGKKAPKMSLGPSPSSFFSKYSRNCASSSAVIGGSSASANGSTSSATCAGGGGGGGGSSGSDAVSASDSLSDSLSLGVGVRRRRLFFLLRWESLCGSKE